MEAEGLEALSRHLAAKIGLIKRLLQLRGLGRREMLAEVGMEVAVLHGLLGRMEEEVNQRRQLAAALQEMRKRAEKEKWEAERLQLVKKAAKEAPLVNDAPLISDEEFESVPGYMRGRLTLAQTNAALRALHAAAASKYRLLRHPPKSLPASSRSLCHRFREEETKETQGLTFVVEADLKEFTQLKVDRTFHRIVGVLRHCRRLREVRGARLVRYVLP